MKLLYKLYKKNIINKFYNLKLYLKKKDANLNLKKNILRIFEK